MKSIFKLIIISNILLLCSFSSHSQQIVPTMDILKEKSWELILPSPKECEYSWYFTQDTVTASIFYKETVKLKYEYYLSDYPDTVFDSTRIGKNTNGVYILKRGHNRLGIYKIVTLTPTYLKLQNMKNGNIMEFRRKEE